MRATFKLLNSYFWKTIYGPIISLVIPLILLLILGNIFKIQYIYPGIIALSFLFIGLLSLPLAIMELKRSALFKYIGTSPINPIRFTIVSVLYFVFVAIAAALVIFFATMIFFKDEVFPSGGFSQGILGGIYSTVVGFFSFYISTGIHLVFVILFGLAISTFSKTPQQALTIGISVIIPSMFLSGIIIPVNIIAQSDALNWVSRFIPFRYSTGNMVIASTPLNQLGDMVSRMDISQKQLLFTNVIDNGDSLIGKNMTIINGQGAKQNYTDILGHTNYKVGDIVITYYSDDDGGESRKAIARSLDDLANIKKQIGIKQLESSSNIHDKPLYNLTLKVVMQSDALHSDNNIFKLNQEWAVERMPQIGAAREFIKNYFKSYTSTGGFSRLKPIADQITNGKFGWLNIFLKQTNTLYYIPDRALNLFVPILFSITGVYYIVNNFKWSIR